MFTQWINTPFSSQLLEELSQEFNSLLNNEKCWNNRFPAVQIGEDEKNVYVAIFAPGIDKESLQLTVENHILRFEAKHKSQEITGDKVKCSRKERTSGSFSRDLQLPETADADQINATYKDGIVSIVIGKRPETQPRQIPIRSE